MKKAVAVAVILPLVLAVTPVRAQLAPKNAAGASAGHVHLTTSDPDRAHALFVALGGRPTAKGNLQLIEFPGVYLAFLKAEPTGPSVGSVVNHIGFTVKNLQETAARWKSAGGTVEAGTSATQNWFTTPDGARVEINERPAQDEAVKFDHIHFFSPAPNEGEEWYGKFFGAIDTGRNDPRFLEAQMPGVLLRFNRDVTQAGKEGSKGRAIDHIGFDVANLDEVCQRLQAAGIKLDVPIRTVPPANFRIAFVTDPWGTYIELTEHLTPAVAEPGAGAVQSHPQ
jgi:catechol 2,3-dioxygenase-like lactoylglutathione lyase family enzyme